jgi:heme exporter protein A
VHLQAVTVAGLTKRFGHHRALAGVDLELRAGSMCAVLGPNGAGKSTLLGILSTLVRQTSGEVVYRAEGSGGALGGERLRRQIGVLAHSAFVYGELTGLENLMFYGALYDVPDCAARAGALLDQVGLDERARERAAGTYSRGMLQRLALARALLHDPRLLLLDEPFTGLDRTGAAALSETLAGARRDGRITMVITHDLESIGGFVDHVAILRRGKLVHEDRAGDGFGVETLKELYHRYSD